VSCHIYRGTEFHAVGRDAEKAHSESLKRVLRMQKVCELLVEEYKWWDVLVVGEQRHVGTSSGDADRDASSDWTCTTLCSQNYSRVHTSNLTEFVTASL